MRKGAVLDYGGNPEISTPDVRIYEIQAELKKGYNAIAFVSKEVTGQRKYVFRPGYSTDSFTGVDIDIVLPEVQMDLPAGQMVIWEGDHLSGSAYLGNTAIGEDLNLKGIARSIELTGLKTSVQKGSDSKYWHYENRYWLRNLSRDSQEIVIE